MGNNRSRSVYSHRGEERDIFLRSLKKGDITMASLLSTTKGNVNACDDKGTTALHVSAMSGHVECVRYLLQRNADLNKKDLYQLTPLHVAAGHGRTGAVQELFNAKRKVFCNERDIWGYTPLHRAVINYHFDTAEAMISNGCLVNVADENKRVPLHVAASYGHLGTTRKLLDCGANIDWQDSRGRTPLYLAVVGKHDKVIQELVNRGANVNLAHAINKMTPLGLAAQKGFVEGVRILIAGGSNCSSQKLTDNDVAPLETALSRASNRNGKRFKDYVRICEMLIEADGGQPGPQSYHIGYQALKTDASSQMIRLVHLLFAAGVKPKLQLTMQTQVDTLIYDWFNEYVGQCLSLQDQSSRAIRRHLQTLHGNVTCAASRLSPAEIPSRIQDMIMLRHLYNTPIVEPSVQITKCSK